MSAWWESLTLLGQVFACIAIPATLILVIQTIMSIIGVSGGGDGDVDADGDVPDDLDIDSDGVFGTELPEIDDSLDPGFRILSLRSIIAFLTIFGWVGLICVRNGMANIWSLLIAFVCGLIAMFVVVLAMRCMLKLQADGTRNIKNALGKSGTVYLTVPAQRNGTGKVNILLQDTFVELDAVTDEENSIKSGREVVVVGLSGQTTVVVKEK